MFILGIGSWMVFYEKLRRNIPNIKRWRSGTRINIPTLISQNKRPIKLQYCIYAWRQSCHFYLYILIYIDSCFMHTVHCTIVLWPLTNQHLSDWPHLDFAFLILLSIAKNLHRTVSVQKLLHSRFYDTTFELAFPFPHLKI